MHSPISRRLDFIRTIRHDGDMCGRFNLRTNLSTVADIFDVAPRQVELPFRYNIAPTQTLVAIRQDEDERELFEPRWGLIPS